ncbi:MAG: ROK family protein [Rhodoglobus sp.]
MTSSHVHRGTAAGGPASTRALGFVTHSFSSSRALRPSSKVLPEHARGHNRSLVLQTLYRSGVQSRADIARETGLTRVTISDLVASLIEEGLIIEMGQREDSRPGKPATLIDLNRSAFHIIGLDLSEYSTFRGAVLDLDGQILHRAELPLADRTGQSATALVIALAETLIASTTLPLLGLGVGSPGVVDLAGVVLSAPNLGWVNEPLQRTLADRFGIPVIVSNDANVAMLAEHSFGLAANDMMLVAISHGVGAGILLGGIPIFGSHFAAGEIGHVVVGDDRGRACACGKSGCLETWLAIPHLERELAAAPAAADRDHILREAGKRLGVALAPVVGALDLSEIVLSGPEHLLDGPLAQAAAETLRARTMAEFHCDLTVRMTALGEDIVMRGAAVMVLSRILGVS